MPSQNRELKVAKMLNAGKGEMSSLCFQLIGENGFNQKIPMFPSKDAIITSQNQDDTLGVRNTADRRAHSLRAEGPAP